MEVLDGTFLGRARVLVCNDPSFYKPTQMRRSSLPSASFEDPGLVSEVSASWPNCGSKVQRQGTSHWVDHSLGL